MIRLMQFTQLYTNLIYYNGNGLGILQPIKASVTQELNGIYEFEMQVLDTDLHFNEIETGSILKIDTPEGQQLFKVYFVSKAINHKSTVKAAHISYDLNKIPVTPFTSTGANNTCQMLRTNKRGDTNFTITTTLQDNTTEFVLDQPRSFRECLGGWDGSFINTFQCEVIWDNVTVQMVKQRGTYNHVKISYGKNLMDYQQEENIEDVYTSVLGYANKNDNVYVGQIYDKVALTDTVRKTLIVDFSSEYEGDTEPTTADLTQKAQEYANIHSIEIPKVNIKISFLPLWQTEEYKNIQPLEEVNLGDTIDVYFERLNVVAQARVVKTVYDCILNKYDSVELGQLRTNISSIVNQNTVTSTNANLKANTAIANSDYAASIASKIAIANANTFFGGPTSGSVAEPTFRQIVNSDLPVVSAEKGGTGNTSLKASSNALINALDTASATPIDSTYLVTAGNTSGLLSTFYRRPISALKTYIAEQLTGTSMVTTASTMTANVTPANKYDNHGALEKFGRVCTLDLNCDYSASYSIPTKIGTLPTGYRPRVKHTINVHPNSGTSSPYIVLNTNGDVQLGGYTSGIGFRALITYITAL